MRNEKKIEFYRNKTTQELDNILKNPNLPESDVIIATIENNHKKLEEGTAVLYSTEEVLENIFAKNRMVGNG